MQIPEKTPEKISPGFYVVATPIGNLRDITLRALDVLAHADLILAEDTRRTRKLLSHYNLKNPARLRALHDHSPAKHIIQLTQIISKHIAQGGCAALVSDAGTPLISDPGFKLMKSLIANDIKIFPVPGASSVMAALSIAGLPAHIFTFAGFLPSRSPARLKFLQKLTASPGAIVFFETAPRLAKSLADMVEVFSAQCPAMIAREMTKVFEEIKRENLGELAAFYAQAPQPKGEITIIIAPIMLSPSINNEVPLQDYIQNLADLPPSQAAAQLSRQTGQSRSALYAQIVAAKKREK